MIQDVESKQNKDGGYYAIKGFIYQFDLTLIEILKNPELKINFEKQQDIDYEKFVIQVKHKETANYSLSKIKPAIIQLFQLSLLNSEQSFKLYCHFKNKTPQNGEDNNEKITYDQLKKILGKNNYSEEAKLNFIEKFEIVFFHDYLTTFNSLIQLIVETYSIKNIELAYYYHALFQSELAKRSIKEREFRTLTSRDLNEMIRNSNQVIFYEEYRNRLDDKRYINMIRSEYFMHKKSFIIPSERLFIIECDSQDFDITLEEIVYNISKKFFMDGNKGSKSPAPFICFRNINILKLKQKLFDDLFYFNDGTYFNGDRFRIDKLLNNENSKYKIRFINESELEGLKKLGSLEVYQFYKKEPLEVVIGRKKIDINIKNIEEIKQIIS